MMAVLFRLFAKCFQSTKGSNMLLKITAQPQAVPRGERLNIEDGEREAVTRRGKNNSTTI